MVPVLRRKPGFTWNVYAPGGFRILAALDGLSQILGFDVTLTAGTNDHVLPDPHATGEAFDVRILGWSAPTILHAVDYLTHTLGPLFTVLYEVPTVPSDPHFAAIAYHNPGATAPHLHVQTKKGQLYPPLADGAVHA